MVGFSLDFGITATCLKCSRDIDVDTLRGCERVLQPAQDDGAKVYVVEKPGACPQCGCGRVWVTMCRGH